MYIFFSLSALLLFSLINCILATTFHTFSCTCTLPSQKIGKGLLPLSMHVPFGSLFTLCGLCIKPSVEVNLIMVHSAIGRECTLVCGVGCACSSVDKHTCILGSVSMPVLVASPPLHIFLFHHCHWTVEEWECPEAM